EDTKQVIADLTTHEQEAVIAKGGRGGRGNSRFQSPRNPAPAFAENGEPGEDKNIKVELNLIADVGLVGFPSVGKSTLLSVVTADLPGLSEGTHAWAVLRYSFLRHIEPTMVLVHVIDIAAIEGRDPYGDYLTINQELKEYDEKLMKRPQIVVANKMDMRGAE